MTPEQKEKFIKGMVTHADKKNGACPSDFGMEDFKNEMCRPSNCAKCAWSACRKFFEDNGL